MLKFASADVLSVELAAGRGLSAQAKTVRTAHRATFQYEKRPGFLYVRSRAISSRCNDNFDEFPAEEIKKAYASFVGKPVFVNHNNDDPRRARGVIIDAALHEDTLPDGKPDTWAEVLMEVDAVRFPKLAKAILAGEIDRTSMGTDVAFSKCSVCGNKATTPLEYCAHIPRMKGSRVYRATASGKKEGVLVREICYGLGFFENSLLVEEPADPTAYFLGVEAGAGISTTAARQGLPLWVTEQPQHSSKTAGASTQKQPFVQGHWTTHDTEPGPDGMYHARCSCGHVGEPRANSQAAYDDHLTHAMWGNPDYDPAEVHQRMLDAQDPKEDMPVGTVPGHMTRDPAHPANWQLASLHSFEAFMADHGVLVFDAARGPNKGDKFFEDNPVHADHIVNRFLAATDEEHHAGINWYQDAHHIAKVIGRGDAAKAAGLMGVYSAGTPVAPNYHYASRAIHHNAAIGGPKEINLSGIPEEHRDFHGIPNANESQRDQAHRMLSGEHHSEVLTSPKVSNYAHVIEHGGDEPGAEHEGRVVVDRHAISAAINRRLTDKEFGSLQISKNDASGKHGIDGNSRYATVANAYREATRRLRAMGHDVKPHQVQAVAWTVQKRLNDEDEERQAVASGKPQGTLTGRQTGQNRNRDAWQKHYQELHNSQHMPDYPHLHWGQRLAYGETMAPAEVDTLREEACPVCDEKDSYDGAECMVCGFVKPPDQFMDPDTDAAKRNDLRQDQGLDAGDVGGLNDDLNDRDGDGLDDETGLPVDDPEADAARQAGDFDEQPTLGCPNCGETFEAAEPQSTNPRDPQGHPDGAAEGDVCPNCGVATLESDAGADAQIEEQDDPDGDDDGDGIPNEADDDADGDGIPDDEEDDDEDDEDERPVRRRR